MKISRIMALSLLVLLGGTTIVAVCLHAQAPVPRNPGVGQPNPEVGGSAHQRWSNGVQYPPIAPDSKTFQLINEEQAADQEAQTLSAQYAMAATDEQRADFKKKLKEKLAAIF